MIHAGSYEATIWFRDAGLGGHTFLLTLRTYYLVWVRGGRCHRLPCITRLGTWNVRGINGAAKREEVADVFREGNFELLALTEMKLKGKGEISLCGVNGIVVGVNEMEKAREGVVILLNDVWHSAEVDC